MTSPQPKWRYTFTCMYCGGHIMSMSMNKKKGDTVLCGECFKSQILK